MVLAAEGKGFLTAVAKGLTRTRTIGLHTLRNSLIPVVTYIGADFGALLGGAIITERIFNIPGIGRAWYPISSMVAATRRMSSSGAPWRMTMSI